MTQDFDKDTLNRELVPEMPAGFSEAVDTAIFTAIRQETGKRQETEKERAGVFRKQRMQKVLATAAAVVLLMLTAFTAGVGLFHRQDNAQKSILAATAEEKKEQPPTVSVEVMAPWDGKLTAIPLYSNMAPQAVRYDLTDGGYAYADTLLDLVQEKLSWAGETDYDELWLLAVLNLSKWDFDTVTYTGAGEFDPDNCPWMTKESRIFALVQYDFAEGEGPMLVECALDEKGMPAYCEIKTLSCDPERDGLYYRNTECSTSAAYLGYGINACKGQMTCGFYHIAFTAATSLSQSKLEQKLGGSAHKEHIRQWYLYPAPSEPGEVQLFTYSGEEKDTAMGPIANQTMSINGEVGLRMTFDGNVSYNVGIPVENGMDEEQMRNYVRSGSRYLFDWDVDFPQTFRIGVNRNREHSVCLETNRSDLNVKKLYVYEYANGEFILQSTAPETIEELFSLEKGEWRICLLAEVDGQEYLLPFTMFLYEYDDADSTEKDIAFTPIAKRYDLTGGWVYSDNLLDAVEATLQAKGIAYEELWLEAVHDFNQYPYDLLTKRYGEKLWLRGAEGKYCLALVQYDFSEGAGPMLVVYYYGNHPEEEKTVGIILSNVDPNVDSCYGYAASETDPPYVIADRYYCIGTDVRSGEMCYGSFLMDFTSQLPLEQVQELVKDSPNKAAAREWYLLPVPAKGTAHLYDAEGQERELRHGNTVYDGNYKSWNGDYRDDNA